MPKIVIADDQELVRAGLRAILSAQPDLDVVAEAEDGAGAATLARAHGADVVLMDLQMPGTDGLDGLDLVRAEAPDARVVMLTMYDLDEYVEEALRRGAVGFLLKTSPPAELVAGVRDAHAGRQVFAASVTERLVAAYLARSATTGAAGPGPGDRLADRLADDLSPRELEVLQALAEGLSNAEIARRLFLTEATVKTYVTRLLAKLGVRDRVQAVVLAYRSGLHLLERRAAGRVASADG